MCCLWFGDCSLERLLPGSFFGLAGLTRLLLSALRFRPRLAELLLRLSEFALEPVQLALKPADLMFDSFDPGDRGVLGISREREDRRTDRSQRTADAIAAAGFGNHAPPFPL